MSTISTSTFKIIMLLKNYRYSLIPLFISIFIFSFVITHKKQSNIIESAMSKNYNAHEDFVWGDPWKGKLDVLIMDAATFKKIPNDRYVFTYKLMESKLSMDGWKVVGFRNIRYTTNPVIVLKNWKESNLYATPDMYFGNGIMTKKEVKKIKKTIIENPKLGKVFFVPSLDKKNSLVYTIFIGNEISTQNFDEKLFTPTGVITNPSPPKNYNGAEQDQSL